MIRDQAKFERKLMDPSDEREPLMDVLRFRLNGHPIEVSGLSPTTTLLNYLREHQHLTGTKEGCAEGDCGACTVVVLDAHAPTGPRFRAVNSCLLLLPMLQNKDVFTVEGIRNDAAPHPVQQRLIEALGSQCGYCTPGIIMSMFEACYRDDLDEDWKIDDQMCGNLCRCTGYRPILEATQQIAGLRPQDDFAQLLQDATPQSMALSYEHGAQHYFTPDSFEALWDLLDAHPDARLVCGGTDLSLEITKQFKELPLLISLEGLQELHKLEARKDGLHIGAAVVLSDLETAAKDVFPSIERMLRFFGARQIKNRGTLGGNLCTASPIGDLAPVLLSLGAVAQLRSRDGLREMPLHHFFTGYRQTALQPKEILDSVWVPKGPQDADIRCIAYKVSKRQELDISTVSAGLWAQLDAQGVVQEARFAFGGMAATPARATQAEAAVIGKTWDEATAEAAAQALAQDFTPITDHRGSAWYRQTVAANLLRGFYQETLQTPQPRLPYRPTGTVVLEVQP